MTYIVLKLESAIKRVEHRRDN